MMGIENGLAFMVTALIFIMTPGIDTVFVLNKSISQGRKSGIYAMLRVNAGVLTHTLFAALGLSVLIAKSAFAFMLIKYLGAVYLVYLGFMKLRNNENLMSVSTGNHTESKQKNDFWSGFLTNTLNPKVALFFLAFFPQFIKPDQFENPIPFMLLGLTYALIGICWYLIVAVTASTFSQKLMDRPASGLWINRVSGCAFIGMGIKIALGKN
ncbi:LysE family translocator [Algoriphagus sp. AGSA1]|uniref:LysE family translocator n=1 Tax=Algoriphagus sp. AGSA1 TaxID=2907213 RepID=UPI001F20B695|nr:LysE family translocator [Algoriphagus sp. AGSA1]MCE7053901.1 LysE family translocator [Algoriphagus sp. AGSA1]